MDSIAGNNECFTCRQENEFAILVLKERAQKILTTVRVKEDLMSLLSAVQDSPDIKGLALIDSTEYPGDVEYKRFLEVFLEGELHEGKWRYGLTYKTAIHQLLDIIINFSIPIVGGMNGNIEPTAFGMSLAFDFRLATEKTNFLHPNMRLGLPPSGVLSFFLVRNVGPAKAVDLILTKSTLSAGEALDLGLITRIVPEEELEYQCIEKLRELSVLPRNALAETRRLLQPDINEAQKHIDAAFEMAWRNLWLLKR